MIIMAEKGDYRLVNDGGNAVIPYLLTIEKKVYESNECVAWDKVPDTPIYTDLAKANIAFADLLIKEHQV